jgi:hypothetical protein
MTPNPPISFPYVAKWSRGDVALVRHTGERVVTVAKRILDALGKTTESGSPGETQITRPRETSNELFRLTEG